MEELSGWFAGRIPADWFVGAPAVSADREEIMVTGTLSEPELPADAGPEAREAALGRAGLGLPGGHAREAHAHRR